jgi:hypothetical protein
VVRKHGHQCKVCKTFWWCDDHKCAKYEYHCWTICWGCRGKSKPEQEQEQDKQEEEEEEDTQQSLFPKESNKPGGGEISDRSVVIKPNEAQLFRGATVGIQRQIYAIVNGFADKHWDNKRGVETARAWGNHVLGAIAELIVGVYLNATWTASTTLESDKPDLFHNVLGALEVRCSPTRRTLHVYSKDFKNWPDTPFVGCYCRRDGTVEILGWIEKPRDGALEMFQQTYGTKDKHYEVPEKHLRPIAELLARVAKPQEESPY